MLPCSRPPTWDVYTDTNRSGSATFRGRSRRASTTLNIVVLAPMPSAMTATAAIVAAGFLWSIRAAKRRSLTRECIAYTWSVALAGPGGLTTL